MKSEVVDKSLGRGLHAGREQNSRHRSRPGCQGAEGTPQGFGTVLRRRGDTEAGREPAGALSARNRDSDFSLQDSGKLWGGREQDLGIGLSTYNVRGFRDPCQVNELESGQT